MKSDIPTTRLMRLCFVLVLLGSPSSGNAQAKNESVSDARTPVIRTETGLVLVDTVVTDKKGEYVRELAAGDFRIFEDGKEQPVKTFSRESRVASTPAESRHYVVLLFDNSTMKSEDQLKARQMVLKFIDTNRSADRLMAVADFSGTLHIEQNFTADADKLKSAVIGAKNSAVPPSGGPIGTEMPSLSGAEGNFGARNLILALRSLANNLAPVPGRKTIVLLSSGFPITSPPLSGGEAADRTNELTVTVDACSKARVAVYPIDVRGQILSSSSSFYAARPSARGGGGGIGRAMATGQSRGRRAGGGGFVGQQPLFMLADGTGGFLVHDTNDLLEGMEKIVKEINEFYIIGYTPPESREGSCHSLLVKLNRGGTLVRARTGYCNVKAPDLLAGGPVEKQLESRLTGAQAGGFPASLEAPFFHISPDAARVNLTLEIPTNAWKFEKEDGKLQGTMNILGVAYRPDGGVAARFSDSVRQSFASQAEIDEFGKMPLRYENQFEIGSGKYVLKVAFSAHGDSFGKAEVPLDIDSFETSRLGISGLALSDAVRPLPTANTSPDLVLLEDHAPLAFNGMEVVPSATNRFATTETPGIYVELYEPLLLDSKTPTVEVQLVVLDRKNDRKKVADSGQINVSSFIHPGSAVIPVGLKLPIHGLPPGSYHLAVRAKDSAGNTSNIRSVDFELN